MSRTDDDDRRAEQIEVSRRLGQGSGVIDLTEYRLRLDREAADRAAERSGDPRLVRLERLVATLGELVTRVESLAERAKKR